jgi:uncharacterized lipoprotein YddW (UPF0748 family)
MRDNTHLEGVPRVPGHAPTRATLHRRPLRLTRARHAVLRSLRAAPLAAALLLGLSLAAACASDPAGPETPGTPTPNPGGGGTPSAPDTAPTLRREFRGLWTATVANIDWPSRAGLPAAQQQAELVSILDRARAARLNAVILHVRPAADALYASALEPWSRYLTGTQGQDPGWDPLAFAVTRAHERGLELHAWVNPFRAGNASDTARFAATHVWNARRDLARRYGAQVWMDPGLPEVQERTMSVVKDIVQRYDVDAVHLDDYFYPYLERDAANRILDFPDSVAYARFNPRGLSRADWRRDNINRFVERLYGEVHAVKPWVRVGISPFGIWRPGNPAGVSGLDAFTEIYADSKLWLNNGWVDYFAPQLYWRIDPPQQSYTALLAWWVGQNAHRRHLWPGNATYKVNDGTAGAFTLAELPNQVAATRATAATPGGATGNIMYNTTTTLTTGGGAVAAALAANVYQERALPPATPWLDATPPAAPTIAVTADPPAATARTHTVRLAAASAADAPRWWVVQHRVSGRWAEPLVLGGAAASATLTVPTADGALERVSVRAADAVWNLSAPALWRAPAAVAAARPPR